MSKAMIALLSLDQNTSITPERGRQRSMSSAGNKHKRSKDKFGKAGLD